MDCNPILEQLGSLKLSNGVRVTECVRRHANGPTSVSETLKALMNERPAAVKETVEELAKQRSECSACEVSGARNNSPQLGEGKAPRKLRATPKSQRAVAELQPRNVLSSCSQPTLEQQPSDAFEKLVRVVSSANVGTVREASNTAAPVAIALFDKGPTAVRMATVVAGEASSPKLLGQIDNLGAQKPIIRSAPPCEHRYIIVGDVHGCPEQLEQLLLKVNFKQGEDCLIHVGDLVNKGPDSLAVVQLVQRLGGIGVLGNHDYTLLNCIARVREGHCKQRDVSDPVMRLASTFPRECEEYLRSLPHILRIPQYNVLVVHAGLNVGLPLEEQNVHEIMHLRRLEQMEEKKHKQLQGGKPRWRAVVKGTRGEPWGTLWNGPECVVFGHDARAGLQELPFAYGLDTGCVYGGDLTAVVYGRDSPKGKLVSVAGLPSNTNEKHGLPPPAADIYEKYAEELERLIIRPTPRLVSPAPGSGPHPMFLSAPPTASPHMAGSMTASRIFSPGCPSVPSLPACCISGSQQGHTRALDSSLSPAQPFEAERITLLALSRARELRALKVLICLPVYESAWLASLETSSKDQAETFVLPFVKGVLDGLLNLPRDAEEGYVDEVLQMVLEACDELGLVRSAVAPQLRELLRRKEGGLLNMKKGTLKLLELVAVEQTRE
ncbi:putative Calcineurin like phosphoesterase [Trypanosoma vivax]|uniref:Putative kinetoplastid-specific phospho-protein phosphatase n=1 Tax=Trypanosoma vivax (strain Y486) TaxID=1055687 RepID=G0TW85_TRYVY|nr:putative Calcineurin like phosphoesterase [Trypanosoma vivax]CCC48223.1 putative kinetoplastid-specific phospho-protein phosphatase [Trypanosoma vivax Y486]